MPYSRASPKQVTNHENPERTKFMNNNTIQGVATTLSAGIFSGFLGLALTGNILTGVAIGVSYLTVAALIAMAVADYRSGPKAYFAAPVVTGHFKPSVSGAVSPRAPSVKPRLAA